VKPRDPSLLDVLNMDADEFTAADSAQAEEQEAQARAAFLDGIANPTLRRALARDPAALARVQRMVSASVFCTGSEAAANYGRAVAQAALEAAITIAGAVAAAKAGRASGASTKAKLGVRDALIRAAWAETAVSARDAARVRLVRVCLRRQGVCLSERQILRVVHEPTMQGKRPQP
jgi:hypothetical protein